MSLRKIVLLVVVFSTCASAIKVRFYEGSDKSYFFSEMERVGPTCTNIDLPHLQKVITNGSIVTDTCLMIYVFPDCTGWSAKIYPGSYNINPQLFNMFSHEYGKNDKVYSETGIASLFPCNNIEGGPALNVDVFWKSDQELVQFKDVCSCRNLPGSLLKLLLDGSPRADNHGNSFMKYTKSDCRGEPRLVPAGRNEESEWLYSYGEDRILGRYIRRKRIVESIGPVTSSRYYQQSCVKLTASVEKFKFLERNVSFDENDLKTESVLLEDETVITNNSSAKISQEYVAAKQVEQRVELNLVETLTNIFKIEGEFSLEVGGKAGIPFLTEGNVKAGLKAVIANEDKTKRTEGTKKIVSVLTVFTARKNIEVGACTAETVKGIVTMVNDRPLEYEVYSTISGEFGETGERMTAEQVKSNIGSDLKVLEEVDKWTVRTVGRGEMKVRYRIRTEINAQGTKIPNCVAK